MRNSVEKNCAKIYSLGFHLCDIEIKTVYLKSLMFKFCCRFRSCQTVDSKPSDRKIRCRRRERGASFTYHG